MFLQTQGDQRYSSDSDIYIYIKLVTDRAKIGFFHFPGFQIQKMLKLHFFLDKVEFFTILHQKLFLHQEIVFFLIVKF